jgi:hypothetical protein
MHSGGRSHPYPSSVGPRLSYGFPTRLRRNLKETEISFASCWMAIATPQQVKSLPQTSKHFLYWGYDVPEGWHIAGSRLNHSMGALTLEGIRNLRSESEEQCQRRMRQGWSMIDEPRSALWHRKQQTAPHFGGNHPRKVESEYSWTVGPTKRKTLTSVHCNYIMTFKLNCEKIWLWLSLNIG